MGEIEMKDALAYFIAIVGLLGLIIAIYWLAKHGSYWLWYDSMVQDTMRELLKPECFK